MIVGPLSWLFAESGDGFSPPDPTPTPAPVSTLARVETMCWVNDVPVESLGLILDQPSGWLEDRARGFLDGVKAPGRTGGYLGAPAGGEARVLVLQGHVLNVALLSQTDVTARLTEQLHGLLELRWAHAPERVLRGEVLRVDVSPANPRRAFVRPSDTTLAVRIEISCRDSAFYRRAPRRMALSSSARAIPVGSLAVGGEVWINGPISAPLDLELYGAHGAPLAVLALRDAPSDPVDVDVGESLRIRIDSPRAVLRYHADGSIASHPAWWNATFSTPALLASLSVGASSVAPITARLSSGTGWWILPEAWAH